MGIEQQTHELQAEELALDSYMEELFIKKYLDKESES
jgi:hypothetical protein